MLRRKLEADFSEYYGANLYDLFDPDCPKMTVRWVVSHLENLPNDSRLHKHFNNSFFGLREHMLADLIDILKNVAYYTSVGATSQIDKNAVSKIHHGAPKPMERPKIIKEPKKFTSGKELKEIMGTRFK